MRTSCQQRRLYGAAWCGAVYTKRHCVILLVKRSVYAILRCYVPYHETVHLNDINVGMILDFILIVTRGGRTIDTCRPLVGRRTLTSSRFLC